jgi:hypothetical protein
MLMTKWSIVTIICQIFKKNNPQVLPPAGKNFYDYRDKEMFINAQRRGTMAIDSPVEYNKTIKNISYILEDNKKRSGKKLYSGNFANAHPAYTPLQIESPPRITDKYDQFYGILKPNNSQTMDYRLYDEKNKLNGKFNIVYSQ